MPNANFVIIISVVLLNPASCEPDIGINSTNLPPVLITQDVFDIFMHASIDKVTDKFHLRAKHFRKARRDGIYNLIQGFNDFKKAIRKHMLVQPATTRSTTISMGSNKKIMTGTDSSGNPFFDNQKTVIAETPKSVKK